MARKTKPGIEYFSHDVDMLQDKKIKLLKAKHGLIGYAVYLRLLEELYRENGYYLKVDDDFIILFADDNNLPLDVCNLILNDCIERELFDKKMFDKYKILTSERVQENYCNATERRKSVIFIKEYLLININNLYKSEKINVCIESLNVNINSLNADISTQSKVKESKGNYSDELKILVAEFIDYSIETFGKSAPKKTDSLIESSCDTIDKLMRLDGFTFSEVVNTINFAKNDDFWSEQIKSLASLRKKRDNMTKFQKVYSKMKKQSGGFVEKSCSNCDYFVRKHCKGNREDCKSWMQSA